jgi:hypothetical protein
MQCRFFITITMRPHLAECFHGPLKLLESSQRRFRFCDAATASALAMCMVWQCAYDFVGIGLGSDGGLINWADTSIGIEPPAIRKPETAGC